MEPTRSKMIKLFKALEEWRTAHSRIHNSRGDLGSYMYADSDREAADAQLLYAYEAFDLEGGTK